MPGESVLLSENATPLRPTGKLSDVALRTLFMSDDVFATSLLTFCVDRFGLECVDWTPQTLTYELDADYGIKLNQFNLGKLLAAMQILETDDFFQRLPMFCTLAEALCGNGLKFEEVAMPDAREIAWAITEAMLIQPDDEPEGAENLFVPEISAFIGRVLREEGIYNPPDVLRVAAGEFFSPNYDALPLANPTEALGVLGANQEDAEDLSADHRQLLQQLRVQLLSLPLKNGEVSF